MVADALIQKLISIGSLALSNATKQPLAREIQALKTKFIKIGISEKGEKLASIQLRPTLIEEIKTKKF